MGGDRIRKVTPGRPSSFDALILELEPDQVLDLPTDRPRPARRSFRGGVATSRVAPCPL